MLAYPVPGSPEVFIPLLVTARHNLIDRTTGHPLPKVVLRYSSKGGAPPLSTVYDLETARSSGDYWEHSDPGVDITIVRTPHREQTEYEPLPLSLVASESQFKQLDIKATDRVIYPTLLSYFTGKTRNCPVMRDGMIALIAEEPIPVRSSFSSGSRDSEQRVILLDGFSVPGASGSPVFLSPTPRRVRGSLDLGGTQPFLVGVMHGFALEKPGHVVEVSSDPAKPRSRENAGVAVVFPSWRVLEILGMKRAETRLQQLVDLILRDRVRSD